MVKVCVSQRYFADANLDADSRPLTNGLVLICFVCSEKKYFKKKRSPGWGDFSAWFRDQLLQEQFAMYGFIIEGNLNQINSGILSAEVEALFQARSSLQ